MKKSLLLVVNIIMIFTTLNVFAITSKYVYYDLPPVPPAPPPDVNVSCAIDVPAKIDLTATDDIDGEITASPSDSYTPGGCPNHFVVVRTWTFTDSGGNTSVVSQTITVEDNEPPVITSELPQDMNLDCGTEIPAPAKLTATDNCGQTWTKLPVTELTPGGCPNRFTLVRTWTFSDTCKNVTRHTQTITVEDNEPPVITSELPQDMNLDCATEILAPAKLTATDNCGQTWTKLPVTELTPGGCPNRFTLVRTWTFSDTCKNVTRHIQTIVVEDNEPPIITSELPQDMNLDCATEIPAPAKLTATDNCGQTWTKLPVTELTPGGCPNRFTLVRTWTFSDTCKNVTRHTQTITVEDNEPPVITSELPQDINLDCATEIPEPAKLTATDNCGQTWSKLPVTELTPGGCPNRFTLVRTWTFSDTCKNVTRHTQTITVEDNEPPVITSELPQDMNLDCATEIPPPVKLTAIDNCGQTWTKSPVTEVTPDGCPNRFTLVRTWTFSDTCKNITRHIQTIVVEDNEPPVITSELPQDMNLDCATEIPAPAKLTATDNCGQTWTKLPVTELTPGGCPNRFTLLRIWTFSDTCKNVTRHTQTITVEDNEPPVMICPPDVTVLCNGIPTIQEDGYFATATDNCDDNITVNYIGEVRADFCEDGYYTLTRSWTASDICGNTSTCDQVITVITDVETDCWILRLAPIVYDENEDVTTYLWKLFGKKGEECKYALSYIKFEFPIGVTASEPQNKSLFVYPENVSKYGVENPSSDNSKKSDIHGIKFSPDGEGISGGGPETFIYSLPGNSVMSNIKVEIKASRESQVADVSIECACSYNSLKSQEIKSEGGLTANEFNYKIYPNPFDKCLNFEFISPESIEINIDVYDITGRKVECIFKDMVMKGIKYNAEFVPKSTITGFYFYKITTQKFVYTGKVIYKK